MRQKNKVPCKRIRGISTKFSTLWLTNIEQRNYEEQLVQKYKVQSEMNISKGNYRNAVKAKFEENKVQFK